MKGNLIYESGWVNLLEGLSKNITLEVLDISNNNIGYYALDTYFSNFPLINLYKLVIKGTGKLQVSKKLYEQNFLKSGKSWNIVLDFFELDNNEVEPSWKTRNDYYDYI